MTRKRKKRASIVVEKVTPCLAVGGDHGVSLWDVKRNEELYATVSAGRGRTSVLCWFFFCTKLCNIDIFRAYNSQLGIILCFKVHAQACVCNIIIEDVMCNSWFSLC